MALSRGELLRYMREFEQAVADAFGAPMEVSASDSGLDVVVPTSPNLQIGVQVKSFSATSLNKTFAGGLTHMYGEAVRARRASRTRLWLTLLIDVRRDDLDPATRVEMLGTKLSTLLRRAGSEGFDQLFVAVRGYADTWLQVADNGSVLEIGALPAVVASTTQRAQEASSGAESQLALRHQGRSPGPLRVLLCADEWAAGTGGISTVNRELAQALARRGCDVSVYVPNSTDSEREDAAAADVTLIDAIPIPGLSGAPLLLTQPRMPESQPTPDVIIGHGRILGPYAYALKNQFFPTARRLHIVHTDAERLELAKETSGGESRSGIGQQRRMLEVELAASADLVLGVGDLLAGTIRDEMAAGLVPGPPVETLVPGLTRWPRMADKARPPTRRQVLIVARADDVQSKGLDIAVRAVARASTKLPDSDEDPITLIIRGVPPEQASVVKQKLESIAAPNVPIILRQYSTDPLDLHRDLLLARLVLMPSRHEGFGLAGLEAISAGVPVRISSESGLARLLRERLPRGDGNPEILATSASEDEVVEEWSDDICDVLREPKAAFERAATAHEALVETQTSWEDAAGRLLTAMTSLGWDR